MQAGLSYSIFFPFDSLSFLPLYTLVLRLQAGVSVVLVNVDGLPGVADPDVLDGGGGDVAAGDHVVGKLSLLGLVLVLRSGQ